jgi:hypothetical protein
VPQKTLSLPSHGKIKIITRFEGGSTDQYASDELRSWGGTSMNPYHPSGMLIPFVELS